MNRSEPQLSISFDLLRKEIQERDEVIGMLKKKLQVMESFHCSSSSLDALNKHRTSSIFVLPEAPAATETPEFPSPKLRSFGLMSETGKRVRCHTDTGVLSLASEVASPSERRRRASLFEHIQRIRMPSFLNTKKKNTGFFKNIFIKLKEKLRRKKTVAIIHSHQQTESTSFQQKHDHTKPLPIELTYEQIITGHFESIHISIDKIENYLKSDDCIEWLGVAKEQLQYLRQDSLEFRKRRVFLCADQLRNYPKEI